jgi:hypothetical protein
VRIFLFGMLALPLGFGCGDGAKDTESEISADADADPDPPSGPMYALKQESPTTIGHLFHQLGPVVHA